MTLILHISSNSPQALPVPHSVSVEQVLVKIYLGWEEIERLGICISWKRILLVIKFQHFYILKGHMEVKIVPLHQFSNKMFWDRILEPPAVRSVLYPSSYLQV